MKDTDSDPTLLAYQLGAVIKPAKTMKLELAFTYYDFKNLDVLEWDNTELDDTAGFLGYNHKHSQQMIFDNNKKLLNEFGCWELGAKLKIKDLLQVPFSVFGSYVKNQEADIDELIEKGVDPGDSDPAKLEKYSDESKDGKKDEDRIQVDIIITF